MARFSVKHIAIGIVLLALLMRLPEMFISLAYDEIWTLLNFTRLDFVRLLFDLELPNNHPLNSILIKLLTYVDLPPGAIRIFSLIAGLASVVLCGLIARKKGGETAMLWSMFFAAISAPLIVYSAQARGYSLQVCFVLLYTYALMNLYPGQPERRWLNIVLLAAGAVGAILSLPTSALFLAAATLILWDHADWKMPPRRLLIVLFSTAAVCLLYILLNLKGLLAARSWGESINSVSGYFVWLGAIWLMLIPIGFVVQTLWGIYTMRRYWKGLTAAFLLIYLSAIFTNGGPHRVYTVITAALAIYGGIGMSKLQEQVTCKYRLPLQMLAILLALAGNFYWDMPRWRFTDYSYVCAVMKNQPPEVLVIYPAGDTYPVLFATGNQAADQYVLSLRDTRARRQLLLVNTAPGSIIGADQDFSQQTLTLPAGQTEKTANVAAQRYELEKLSRAWPDDAHIIAVIHPQNLPEATQKLKADFLQHTNNGKVLLLNLWFTGAQLSDGGICHGAVYYLAPGAVNANRRAGWPANYAGKISFYRINFPLTAQ